VEPQQTTSRTRISRSRSPPADPWDT
jgi:hypothetical protein